MRKIKKRNLTSQVALFAGAAAFMTFVPQPARAQSTVDDLLNKLEQKGILTVKEADELKNENQQDSATDFNKELSSKFPMPDWVTSYKLSGDFRGRFDDETTDAASLADRIRLRYRLRVGLVVDMKDNLEVGFRLGSGDGGPLSNNQTLSDNGSKKVIYVDTAYGKWTPIHNDDWTLAATIGKMNEPFDASAMVFDPDYTPEGGALQSAYKLTDNQSFKFNGAAFVLDEIAKSSRDPFLYGAQAIWDAQWTPQIGTSFGVAFYDIVNKENLSATYDSNAGNTLVGGALVNNYNPVVVDGSATYTLDRFPLYNGKFPIKVAAEYMNNPGADSNNEGYWAGVTFGKSGKKGTWDISYRYQRLEADAWWDQIVDDDNIAYANGGFAGGTNIKGHWVKVDYSITDALTFTFTCYMNDLINTTPGTKSDALHAMADIMWKF
jgi:Putative porin